MERYPIIYGASFESAGRADGRTPRRYWPNGDPFTIPILTEVPGVVKFGDVIEDRTMKEKRDTVTGKISRVIVESREADVRPRISIKDSSGKPRIFREAPKQRVVISCRGAVIMVNEGSPWAPNGFWPKSPERTTKTKDITAVCPCGRTF